jgi:hypothetical protein
VNYDDRDDLDSFGWTRAGSVAVTAMMNLASALPGTLLAGPTLAEVERHIRAVDAAGRASRDATIAALKAGFGEQALGLRMSNRV